MLWFSEVLSNLMRLSAAVKGTNLNLVVLGWRLYTHIFIYIKGTLWKYLISLQIFSHPNVRLLLYHFNSYGRVMFGALTVYQARRFFFLLFLLCCFTLLHHLLHSFLPHVSWKHHLLIFLICLSKTKCFCEMFVSNHKIWHWYENHSFV